MLASQQASASNLLSDPGATGDPAVVDSSDVYSAAAAAIRADALLALVSLPGATSVPSSPDSRLAHPAQSADDNLIDHARWWTMPGRATALIAGLKAHPPAGLTLWGWSSGGTDQVSSAEFSPGGLGSRDTLSISMVQDGSQVNVRADGQVIWLPPRQAAETIPVSVTSATMDYTGPRDSPTWIQSTTTPKPAHAHRTLTGARLKAIVTDLNGLATESPGVRSCPMDFGETATLRFTFGGRHVVFSHDFAGCGEVTVTGNGHQLPTLVGSDRLTTDLYAAIGVVETPIPRVPPQGSRVTTPAPRVTVLEHDRVQAQRVGDAAINVGGPQDAQLTHQAGSPPRPAYAGAGHFVDRASFWTVRGTVAELAAYVRATTPKGFVAAEPVRYKGSLRVFVIEPRDRTKPIKALVLVSMMQSGDSVSYRVDAQTGWAA